MTEGNGRISRRGRVRADATLLAGLVLRPVTAPRADHAPPPANPAAGDPRSISVDLRASCLVESVVLAFETTPGDPACTGASFTLDVSGDGMQWTTVHRADSGTGGVMTVTLPEPVSARHVRMSASSGSDGVPLGLNGFEVYGTGVRQSSVLPEAELGAVLSGRFAFPEGSATTTGGRHVWLEFDGVGHRADVWLDGAHIGRLVHPLARASIDVTAQLAAHGRQDLAVLIAPVPCSGRDGTPAVRERDCGVWNHVRLRSTGAAVIGDPRVETRLPALPDLSVAEVTITVPVCNVESTGRRVTLTAAFDGISVSRTVTVPGGRSVDVVFDPSAHRELRIADPRLWWPNGYGSPTLHDLALTASVRRAESDRRTVRIGLRQVDCEYRTPITVDDEPALPKFVVNGVSVFCRGGSRGWDELPRPMRPDRVDAVMAMHRDMNFTMVRDWTGSSDCEEFFAAADAHGLLVWHDLPEALSADPVDQSVHLAVAQDLLLRYRHHPSIVVWCGRDGGDPPTAIDSALRDAVASSTGLLYGSDSNAGFVTGDDTYPWTDPADYLTGAAAGGRIGFHSEIRVPAVAAHESKKKPGTPESGRSVEGPWFPPEGCTDGDQAPQSYRAAVDARLGASHSAREFARKAQFVDYESTRAIFEACNSRLWQDATGVLLRISNLSRHNVVWPTCDHDLDVDGSYFGSRKGCEPLHIQANRADWSVVAVNHTAEALRGAVTVARLHDLTGQQLGSALQATLDVEASGSTHTFTVPFGDNLPALHLLRLDLRDAKGEPLSQNTYWRYRRDTDMQELNALARTEVRATGRRVTRRGDGGGELTVTLRNTGRTVASMLLLSLRDRHTGDRVLPARYSDNFLWLLPGESRELTLDWTRGLPAGHEPSLWIEGYNVAETVV
jgi:hypothetical protein